MPAKRTHEVVATIGEYKVGDETKKRYANIGSLFTQEDGRMSIKLDTVPCSPDWSGWLSIFPVKDRDDRESDRRQGRDRTPQDGYRQGSPAEKYGKQPYTPPPDDDDSSDIPF